MLLHLFAAASFRTATRSRRRLSSSVAALEALEDRSLLSANTLAACASIIHGGNCQSKPACSSSPSPSTDVTAPVSGLCGTKSQGNCNNGDNSCRTQPTCNQDLTHLLSQLCAWVDRLSCGDHRSCRQQDSCNSRSVCEGQGDSGSCDSQSKCCGTTDGENSCGGDSGGCNSGGDSIGNCGGHQSQCETSSCGEQAA